MTDEALNIAIKALEQIESGRYIKGECSMCAKEYGTLGCCTTVSNHWVYSCKEGMAQYAEALEQEPSRDCISRKWVLNKIHAYAEADTTSTGASVGADYCAEFVEDAPSVTTEQSSKVGKWIVDRYCSECEWDKQEAGYTSGWRENYCPNCGAKMER